MMLKTPLPLLLTTLMSLNSYAALEDENNNLSLQDKDWQLVKKDNRHGITSYSKLEDGKSYRSFKAEVLYEQPFDVTACHQLDANNFRKWFMNSKESRLLQRVSDTEFYMYLRFKAPLAVPDRDVVLNVSIQPYSEKKPVLVISYKAVPDYLPPVSNVVRIPVWDVTTVIKPIDNQQSQEITFGYAEAGKGHIPIWLINFFQKQMPYSNSLARGRDLKTYQVEAKNCDFKYKE
ncbi:hypothetical protein [Agitococcus lubricus]|uniref:START domain-containing protein n=1 Tax=Agitococcus lubricus TaxID=1077255 RepID=A0A2T5IZL5_9GAMM|nr:hypothetical protein [Agitococcus lubricus]PTQ89506.1 hypothetical protein C8N29_10637 [Agitococcus lubricus]